MSGSARVASVEALKEFRVSLCGFSRTAATVLAESRSQIQRTLGWLKQDRHSYWKGQVRLRSERYTQARLALKSKEQFAKSSMGGNDSHVDEKRALALAQREMTEAQTKIDRVQRWVPQLEKEGFAYKGQVQGLAATVEVEIPNARAQLDRMIVALEAYLAATPEMPAAASESDPGSVARTGDDEVEDRDGRGNYECQ